MQGSARRTLWKCFVGLLVVPGTLAVTVGITSCAVSPEFDVYEIQEIQIGAEAGPEASTSDSSTSEVRRTADEALRSTDYIIDGRTLFRLPTARIQVTPQLAYDPNTRMWSFDLQISQVAVGHGSYYAIKGVSGFLTRTSVIFDVPENTRVLKTVNVDTTDLLTQRISGVSQLAAGIIGLAAGAPHAPILPGGEIVVSVPPPAPYMTSFPRSGYVIGLGRYADSNYANVTEPQEVLQRGTPTGWTYEIDFGAPSPTSHPMQSQANKSQILALAEHGILFYSSCREVTLVFKHSSVEFVKVITAPDPNNVEIRAAPASGAMSFDGCISTVSKSAPVERDPLAVGQSLLDAVLTVEKAMEAPSENNNESQ